MKRPFSRFISLLLMLCMLVPSALAEGAEDAPAILEALDDSIRNLFLHDGTLYAQTYWEEFYRQVDGGWRLSGSYPDDDYDIVKIYTDGEDVWFLARKERDAQTEACYQIIKASFDGQGNVTAPESPLTIDWEIEAESWPSIGGLMMDGDTAYVLSELPDDWSQKRLYRVDMTTGEAAKLVDAPLQELTGYRSGLLLAVRFSWDEMDDNGNYLPSQAVVIDPATGELTQLGVLPTISPDMYFNVGGLTYDPGTDQVYYCDNCHVYRVTSGEPELVSYLPPSDYSRQSASALIWQGRYYVSDGREVSSASVDPLQMPQRVLRVQESWALDGDLLRGFVRLHPDIAIEYVNDYWYDLDSFTRVMQSDTAPDVFSTSIDSDFVIIRDKKYLVDLSSSDVLMGLVSRMYPHLTAELLVNGQLFALPIYLDVYTFGYYPRALEKAGVPVDMVPTTFGEMLDFIELWHDEYYEDNEGMEVFEYTPNLRRTLFFEICDILQMACQADGTLTYNTPTMRALLGRLDEMRPIFDAVSPYTEEDYGEYIEDNALFTTMDCDPLPRLWKATEDSIQPMILALDDQTPPVIGASMEVLGINPYSKNSDAAFVFLEYVAQNLGIRFLTAMIPDQNDPIEVYDYERTYERQQTRVANLEARLETVPPEDRRDLEDELQWARSYLDSLEGDGRWAMTTEEIMDYRENIAPYLTLRTGIFSSANASDQMQNIRRRYLDGQMTADEFIQEMDSIVWMVQMEQ